MSKHRLKTHLIWLVLGLLLSTPVAFAAPDYEREKRWHDEVAPNIVTGEPVYLTQKNRHKFLGIYTRAENARMGLVVVHGMGIHPDWGMVNTLREGLAEQGLQHTVYPDAGAGRRGQTQRVSRHLSRCGRTSANRRRAPEGHGL